MFRAVLLAIVTASLLVVSAEAQAFGAARGIPGGFANSSNAEQRGAPNGMFGSRTSHRWRQRSFVSPYFLPDYFGSNAGSYETEKPLPEPFPRVIYQPSEPEKPAVQAQFIEIPGAVTLKDFHSPSSTVFIMTSGERLESDRFLLTASSLSVTVNRQQRVIPLDRVDLAATLAANRERGINLHIPTDHNEISLGF